MSRPVGPSIDGLVFVEHLGEGGYSDVFLYERRSPRMKVAVKVLKDARLSDAERRQFEAEAETMAELADHPYIVQVFSADATEDGRLYLIMKFYPGENLAKRSAAAQLSVADVLRTGVKIASAVETAHRADIIHRDIKPANVLVSPYGEPGLTDFGIAGHLADTDDGDDLGVSIPWSPPEILDGRSNGSVRSDVYSLAATVWHLLVGRSPFEIRQGDNSPRALTQRVLRNTPPSTGRADVPDSLNRLLAHALAKSPEARPRSALEFAQALQSIEQEQRFVRTDIVVPGLDQTSPAAVRRDLDESPDRTRLKAPQRVVGQRPSGPSRFAPDSAPEADQTSTRRQKHVIADVPRAPDAAPATARRPAVARSPLPPGPDAPATVLRPARPAPAAPDAESLLRKGIRPRHAMIAAGVAVVVAVAVGAALLSGGKDQPEASPPSDNSGTGISIGRTDLVAPDIKATYDPDARSVRFSWSDVNDGKAKYRYRLSTQPTGSAKFAPASNTVTIKTSMPAATCILVFPVDDEVTSPSYARRCGDGS